MCNRWILNLIFCALMSCALSCSSKRTSPASFDIPRASGAKPSSLEIQNKVHQVARLKLPYLFGGSSPSDGGMDCSGSIQYLLTKSGFRDVPRTSYAQYDWVKYHSRLKRGKEIEASKLEFGDLIFWGGTYDSGHKVSHVMLYLGEHSDGKLHMFGARSKKIRGINGGGVDIHELRRGTHKNLIGFGRVPGY